MEASVLVIMSLMCVTFLMLRGIIGWLAKQNNLFYQANQQVAYVHPEMFDENGNLIPDEILALRFEQNESDSEEDDEE